MEKGISLDKKVLDGISRLASLELDSETKNDGHQLWPQNHDGYYKMENRLKSSPRVVRKNKYRSSVTVVREKREKSNEHENHSVRRFRCARRKSICLEAPGHGIG